MKGRRYLTEHGLVTYAVLQLPTAWKRLEREKGSEGADVILHILNGCKLPVIYPLTPRLGP